MHPLHYEVCLLDTPVGWLTRDSAGRVRFQFSAAYLNMPNRPVLGQKFEDNLRKVYWGQGERLPPFFANLIPERDGPLRAYLAAAWRVAPTDDLALLAAASNDLPGALTLRLLPAPLPPLPRANPDANEGPEGPFSIAPAAATDDDGDDALDLIPRFSLAGVQMKLSLLRQAEKLTLPSAGELGDWIVKVETATYPGLVENEFAVMEWARAAGFDVPACQLGTPAVLPPTLRQLAPADRPLFMVQRYDRPVGQPPLHQEDFAQVVGLPPEKKYAHATYEKLALLTREMVGQAGYAEFVRRLVLMVASGNGDAHLKNWSLLYPNGINARLTPLYDQVATVAWPQLRFEWALKLVGTKNPLTTDLVAFERLAHYARAEAGATRQLVLQTLEELASGWRKADTSAQLPPTHLTALYAYWRRSPLLKAWSSGLLNI